MMQPAMDMSQIDASRKALLDKLNSDQQYIDNFYLRGAYIGGWIAAESAEPDHSNPYKTKAYRAAWKAAYDAGRVWIKANTK